MHVSLSLIYFLCGSDNLNYHNCQKVFASTLNTMHTSCINDDNNNRLQNED